MAWWGRPAVKMLAEYQEHALEFEHMAANEKDPQVKAQLERQAAAYRKLAEARAKALGITLPTDPGGKLSTI
jgi:hypothetical protein